MAEELLEKIPAETCWALTAKTLWRFIVLQGDKFIAPALGKEDGIIAPVLGAEKWQEIDEKIFAEGGKNFLLWVKETFNLPVENSVGAAKLYTVSGILWTGPDVTCEIVEASRERVIVRHTKCPVWELYEEYEVDPELGPCDATHQLLIEKGFKAINSKLTGEFTKAMPRGDPYCEVVIEFKEE